MSILTLEAELRTDLGKGASRRLRHTNKVPAVVYGSDKEAVSITLEHHKILKAQESEAFYSQILDLNIAGKTSKVLIKDLQRHPFKPVIMHIDFMRVDAKQKLHQSVPVHFLNEDESPAIKAGGTINHLLNEIEVICLPKDLPQSIVIDLAELEVGQTIHLSELKLAKNIQIAELTKGDDHDQAILSVTASKAKTDEEETDGEQPTEDTAE